MPGLRMADRNHPLGLTWPWIPASPKHVWLQVGQQALVAIGESDSCHQIGVFSKSVVKPGTIGHTRVILRYQNAFDKILQRKPDQHSINRNEAPIGYGVSFLPVILRPIH